MIADTGSRGRAWDARLRVYTAPAAGGKTAFAMALGRETAAGLEREVLVCVPSGLQALDWRKRLARNGGGLGVNILTWEELVEWCLAGHDAPPLLVEGRTQIQLLLTLIRAAPLEHYAPLREKGGFARRLRQLFLELRQANLSPIDFQQLPAARQTPRLGELAALYAAYDEALKQRGWVDRPGRQALAARFLTGQPPPARPPLLIVDGFDHFTPGQIALLQALRPRVAQLAVFLTRPAGDRFPRYRRTLTSLEQALGVDARPLPAAPPLPPAISGPQRLAYQFLAERPGKELLAIPAVELCEAIAAPAEARAALRWLKARAIEDKIPLDQLALLALDITPYRPFLEHAAAEFGLPLRFEDGRPLGENGAITALLDLLRLHLRRAGRPDLPRERVVAAWRSPYFHWPAGTIEPGDGERLDHAARHLRIIRGLHQWQDLLDFRERPLPAELSFHEELDEEEGPLPDALDPQETAALARKFAVFLDLTSPPAGRHPRLAFISWLEQLIGDDPALGQDEAGEAPSALHVVAGARANPATAAGDLAALRALKEILRDFVATDTLLPLDERLTFEEFFQELAGAAAAGRYSPPADPNTPAILVANVPQVRGLSFAAVALLGLGEGSFPRAIAEDPLLRDADRQALRAATGREIDDSTWSDQAAFFYEALSRAREKLLLTRPLLADNGAEWVPSPFWQDVVARLGRRREEIYLVPGNHPVEPAGAASEAEWLAASAPLAGDHGWPAAVPRPVVEQIEQAAAVWRARRGRRPTPFDGDLSAARESLSARFGRRHVWSAGRLESYQSCGFFFFTASTLGLAPPPDPTEGLDARQRGSLFHMIFEAACSAPGYPAEPAGDPAAWLGLVETVARPILDQAPAALGFREAPWWPHTRREITAHVARSLQLLHEDGSGFTFHAAELRFGFDDEGVELARGGRSLRLHGVIDRIDRDPAGRLRLIDYKLAGPSSYGPKPFALGQKLQLPLYALAVQAARRLAPEEIADGFYWHFQKGEPSKFTLAAGFEGAEGPAGTMAAALDFALDAADGIRSGRFTPQPPAGGCPSYCPAAAFCWRYTPASW